MVFKIKVNNFIRHQNKITYLTKIVQTKNFMTKILIIHYNKIIMILLIVFLPLNKIIIKII